MAVVKRLGKPVSEVCHRFDPVPQFLKNIRIRGGRPLEDDKVKATIADALKRLGNQGRLVIRPSGTEPLIRVMGEGDDEVLVRGIVDDLVDVIGRAAA